MTITLGGDWGNSCCMGLMIVVEEAACREQWLEVAYSPKDRRPINLGKQAVTVGGNLISQQSNGRLRPTTRLTFRVDKDGVSGQKGSTGVSFRDRKVLQGISYRGHQV